MNRRTLSLAALTVTFFSNVGNFLGTFVPGVGFYLTALGGVHLSVGGVVRVYALGSE